MVETSLFVAKIIIVVNYKWKNNPEKFLTKTRILCVDWLQWIFKYVDFWTLVGD